MWQILSSEFECASRKLLTPQYLSKIIEEVFAEVPVCMQSVGNNRHLFADCNGEAAFMLDCDGDTNTILIAWDLWRGRGSSEALMSRFIDIIALSNLSWHRGSSEKCVFYKTLLNTMNLLLRLLCSKAFTVSPSCCIMHFNHFPSFSLNTHILILCL